MHSCRFDRGHAPGPTHSGGPPFARARLLPPDDYATRHPCLFVRAHLPSSHARASRQRCYDWLKRLCPVTGSDKASGDESVARLIGRVNSSTASSSRFTLATASAHLSAAQMFDRPSFPHPQFL
ncbi:unnamed protein product [Musa acuminata subsp. burmannicoides]